MAKDDLDRIKNGVLGDIEPENRVTARHDDAEDTNAGDDEAMEGGSRHDRSRHSGSRDVTEGTTGGDIGNRPE